MQPWKIVFPKLLFFFSSDVLIFKKHENSPSLLLIFPWGKTATVNLACNLPVQVFMFHVIQWQKKKCIHNMNMWKKCEERKKYVWGIIPSPTMEQIHFPVRAFKTIFTKNARFSPLFPERVISRGGKNNQKGCQGSTLFVLLNDLVWDYAYERRCLRRPKASDPPGAGVVSGCEPPESSGRAVRALPLRHLSGPVRIFYKQCTKDQMEWGPHACDLWVLEVEAGGSEVQGHP